MLSSWARRRWCALALCIALNACAAPGEPTAINSLALGRVPVSAATRPAATSTRVASHPPLRPVTTAASAATRVASRHDRAIPAKPVALPPVPPTPITTVEQNRDDASRAPSAMPMRVPEPSTDSAAFSPLSPDADPVALVPPKGKALSAAGSPQTAPGATLSPGPSLCSLNRDSTADDVILDAQPCPVDLRPTLKPAEPPL